MRQILLSLSVLLLVFLTACGGGGGSSEEQRFVSAQELSASLVDSLDTTGVAFVPVEGSFVTGLGTVDYVMTPLGVGFCLPGDPFADPVSTPLPGQSVFGCANSLSYAFTTGTDTATLTVMADELFGSADLSFSGPISADFRAYGLFSNVSLEVVLDVADAGQGTKEVIGVASVDLACDSLTLDHDQGGSVGVLLDAALPLFESDFTAAAEEFIRALIEEAIPLLPPYMP